RDGRIRVFEGGTGALLYQFHTPRPVRAAASYTRAGHSCELACLGGRTATVYRMAGKPARIASIRVPFGEDALALGDVNGDGDTDALVNGHVFLGPSFTVTVPLPVWDRLSEPVIGMMADVLGRGRSDIVIQHEGPDDFGSLATDCDLSISYRQTDPDWDADGLSNADEARIGSDPLDRCTSHDG